MTEEDKKQVAAFRFGVICELVNGTDLQPGEKKRLIQQKCSRKWQIVKRQLFLKSDDNYNCGFPFPNSISVISD